MKNYTLTDRQTGRNSNLELLRIISMILIIAHHYAVHGFNLVEWNGSLNQYIVDVLSLGGKLGVSCFILISGYFMVYSKITLHKLVKLIAEVWFYSVGIALLFCFVLTPVEPIGIIDLIKVLLPIGYTEYWFMTDYVVLMLLSPVLNITIEKIDKAFHRNLIFLFVILWSVLPCFIKANYDYHDLDWFVILYFIAGYIRKYVDISKKNMSKHFTVAVISYIAVIGFDVIMIWLGHALHMDFLISHAGHMAKLNSLLILSTSVELLLGFLKMKPFKCLWLNKLASATLGVYLIHDNHMVRPYLWHTLLKTDNIAFSKILPVHALCSIVGVYVVCTLIDLLRQSTVEYVFLSILDRHLGKWVEVLGNLWKLVELKGYDLMQRFYGADEE